MTAIQCMKREIRHIQAKLFECTDESGVVLPYYKHTAVVLVRKIRDFKESIAWLESQVYNQED